MIKTYDFSIKGITKDTLDSIISHVKNLNPELEYEVEE